MVIDDLEVVFMYQSSGAPSQQQLQNFFSTLAFAPVTTQAKPPKVAVKATKAQLLQQVNKMQQ